MGEREARRAIEEEARQARSDEEGRVRRAVEPVRPAAGGSAAAGAGEERTVQRAAAAPAPTVSDDVERRLDRSEGRGEALPRGVRRAMEDRLGDDLSDVRVHKDAEARSLARRLDAQAFTTGRDVYFGEGKYRPGTREGDALLAHELTHTVQQKRGGGERAARKTTVSRPGDPDEVEAERVAREVTAPDRPREAAADIQRQPAETGLAPETGAAAGASAGGGAAGGGGGEAAGGEGAFTLRLPGGGVELDLTSAEGGRLQVDLSPYSERVPGLRLGTLEARVRRGRFAGGRIGAGVSVPFVEGDVTLSVTREGELGDASGDLTVELPSFARGQLEWRYAAGELSGSLTVGSDEITVPRLPLKDSSLTVSVAGERLSVEGHATTDDSIPGLSEGRLSVAYDDQRETFTVAINADLDVPGLEASSFTIEKDEEGVWKGSGEAAASFAGASGSVHLEHESFELVRGEGTVGYSRGPLAGSITVRLTPPAEGEPGELAIHGEGDLTVQIAPWLTGTGHAVLHPDGNVDLEGALTFPDEVELFKERKFEKTLFQLDQEFPLWGITIPVVGSIGLIAEIHAKLGARTKFGPGVLRDILVEGTYSTRSGKAPEAGGDAASGTGVPEEAPEPSFAVSGEFFVPAGAELVIIVGGGVGLAVLVAKLTGGIDLVGTAGAYATLSVRPRFQYEDGKYSFKGLAEIQAAAVATLGVDAYAAAEVGIGWLSKEVWRKNWNLAAFVWDPGISLGMRAAIDYTLGEPFEPNLEFEPVEIDPKSLVKSAMPESGQPTPDKPRRDPPRASVRLDPDPEAPAEAERQEGPEGAEGVPGGRPGGPGATPGGAPDTAGGATSGRGEVTRPGEEAPEPTPFVPPRPGALEKVPEDRTRDEAWQVFAWDRFVEQIEGRSGRRVARAEDDRSAHERRQAREAEMRNVDELREAWRKFNEKSSNPAAADEFDRMIATHYWNYHTNAWEERRYTLTGSYKEPHWPLYVSEKKGGKSHPALRITDTIDEQGRPSESRPSSWALDHYGDIAGAGNLVTYPRHPRKDVRETWKKEVEKRKGAIEDPETRKQVAPVHPDDPRLPAPHQVDHVLELQLGGDNELDNLQLLNAHDNMSSGASLAGQIRADMNKLDTAELRYTRVTGSKSERRSERRRKVKADDDDT